MALKKGTLVRSSKLTLLVSIATLAIGASFSSSATASVTSETISGAASPTTQSSTNFGASSLQLTLDTAYSSYSPPTPAQSGVVLHLDNDFALDTTGLAQCSPATISGDLSSAQAIAACPGSKVGDGTATATSMFGGVGGVVTAFNGPLSGSDPTMVLHYDFGAGQRNVVTGAITASSRGGDFGKQVSFSLTSPPGIALTHTQLMLTNQTPSPGHHYLSARCNDMDHIWNFAADYSYADASSGQASGTQACTALAQHTLTVSTLSGSGTGSVTGPGINCPGDCSEVYDDGTFVNLFAFADPGSSFDGWGGDCSGTGACSLTMNADHSVSAGFTLLSGSATLTGVVREPASAGSDPLVGASVWTCGDTTGFCRSGVTNGSGAYSLGGLPADDYFVTALPPSSGPAFAQHTQGPVAVSGTGTFNQDVALGDPPVPLPGGTTIQQDGGTRFSPDGVPAVYMFDPFALATNGCANGTATYKVTVDGVVIRNNLPMTESPAGSGHYTATVTPLEPSHGSAQVHIDITGCGSPSTVDFGIYIDPSGIVSNAATGNPIAGATVTLVRSDDVGGPFAVVPNGSAIMSPSNRTNPDTTNGAGHFGWDVIAGFYKVRATATGCNTVETVVLTIPPPVTDLTLALTCPTTGGGGTVTQPVTTPAPTTATAPTRKKCKKSQKLKKGKCVKKKKKKK